MTALGRCGDLTNSSYVVLNELTTVAAIWSLQPFMTSLDHVGYSGSNAAIIASFDTARQMVNPSTGTTPGAGLAAGIGVPTEHVNTVANVLAACVNSTGGSAGQANACGTLFGYTGGSATTNTALAMLHLAAHPSENIAQLMTLPTANSPFQPSVGTPPARWSISPQQQAAAPTFTPAAGTYRSAQQVLLTANTSGAVMYFTVDGRTPTTLSACWDGVTPISVSSTQRLNVLVTAAGYLDHIVSASYVIQPKPAATPVFSPSPGNYHQAQSVSIVSATPGAEIRYTTDGTTPTVNSTRYTAPLTISSTTTLKAIAIASDFDPSLEADGTYAVTALPRFTETLFAAFNGCQGDPDLGDGGPADKACIKGRSLALAPNGDLYISEVYGDNGRIRRIDAATGVISTVAGTGSPLNTAQGSDSDGPAHTVSLYHPEPLTVGGNGAVYFGTVGSGVRKVASGVVGPFGPPVPLIQDPKLLVVQRTCQFPQCQLAVAGTALVSSRWGFGGAYSVLASDGSYLTGYLAAGSLYSPGTSYTRLNQNQSIATGCELPSAQYPGGLMTNPTGLAGDAAGNLYVADTVCGLVWKVTRGNPSVVAGTNGHISNTPEGGFVSYPEDGHLATQTDLGSAYRAVGVDGAGNVYLAGSSDIRKVDASTGIMSTVYAAGAAPGQFAVASNGDLYLFGSDGILRIHYE